MIRPKPNPILRPLNGPPKEQARIAIERWTAREAERGAYVPHWQAAWHRESQILLRYLELQRARLLPPLYAEDGRYSVLGCRRALATLEEMVRQAEVKQRDEELRQAACDVLFAKTQQAQLFEVTRKPARRSGGGLKRARAGGS